MASWGKEVASGQNKHHQFKELNRRRALVTLKNYCAGHAVETMNSVLASHQDCGPGKSAERGKLAEPAGCVWAEGTLEKSLSNEIFSEEKKVMRDAKARAKMPTLREVEPD